MSKSIAEWQKEIHGLAKEKGWWEAPERSFLEIAALIHSEISEAVEEWRGGEIPQRHWSYVDGQPTGVIIELADAVIRIMDYCERKGYDLETAIAQKHEYNKTRPYKHGGKRA